MAEEFSVGNWIERLARLYQPPLRAVHDRRVGLSITPAGPDTGDLCRFRLSQGDQPLLSGENRS